MLSWHVSLRNSRFDDYKKTSSLAKAIRSRTDRVTLTVEAATVLARRFNEQKTQHSTAPPKFRSATQTPVPESESVLGHSGSEPNHESPLQDHFYEISEDNSISQPVSGDSLNIKQAEAKGTPLPDGTIPPARSTDARSESRNDKFSEILRSAPSERSLYAEEQRHRLDSGASGRSSVADPVQKTIRLSPEGTPEIQRQSEAQTPTQLTEPSPDRASAPSRIPRMENELLIGQEKDSYYSRSPGSTSVLPSSPRSELPSVRNATQENKHIHDTRINQDVYYSPRSDDKNVPVLGAQAKPEPAPVSEEMYSEIFHSPRVAKLLGSRRKGNTRSESLNLDSPESVDNGKVKVAKDRDSESFNTRTSMHSQIETRLKPMSTQAPIPKSMQKDDGSHELPVDIARETHTNASEGQKVGINVVMLHLSY